MDTMVNLLIVQLFVSIVLVHTHNQSVILSEAQGGQDQKQTRRILQQDTTFEIRMATAPCNPQQQNCTTVQDLNYSVSPAIQQTDCTDVEPEETVTCSEYAQYDLCGNLPEEYCANSCGFCCLDEQPSEFLTCEQVAEKKMCDVVLKDGKCKQTCGECQTQADDSQNDPWTPVVVDVTGTQDQENDPWAPVIVDVSNNSAPNAKDENLILLTIGDCSAADSIQCDVEALLSIKSKLNSTFQELYYSWSGNTPCDGSWEHVQCQDVTGTKMFRVTELLFTDPISTSGGILRWGSDTTNVKFLQPLPLDLTKMKFLQQLKFNGAEFSGSIFPEISVLTNLIVFESAQNKLTGTLPPEISKLSQLQEFNVVLNEISGTVPPQYSTLKDASIYLFPQTLDDLCLDKQYEVTIKLGAVQYC